MHGPVCMNLKQSPDSFAIEHHFCLPIQLLGLCPQIPCFRDPLLCLAPFLRKFALSHICTYTRATAIKTKRGFRPAHSLICFRRYANHYVYVPIFSNERDVKNLLNEFLDHATLVDFLRKKLLSDFL